MQVGSPFPTTAAHQASGECRGGREAGKKAPSLAGSPAGIRLEQGPLHNPQLTGVLPLSRPLWQPQEEEGGAEERGWGEWIENRRAEVSPGI